MKKPNWRLKTVDHSSCAMCLMRNNVEMSCKCHHETSAQCCQNLKTSGTRSLDYQLSIINANYMISHISIISYQPNNIFSNHLRPSLCQRATWIRITCYDMMTATDWPLSSDWTNSLTSHRKWNKWTMDNGPWKASRAWLELHNFQMVARSGFQSKWLTVDTPAHNKVQWILEVVWEWWTVDKWW